MKKMIILVALSLGLSGISFAGEAFAGCVLEHDGQLIECRATEAFQKEDMPAEIYSSENYIQEISLAISGMLYRAMDQSIQKIVAECSGGITYIAENEDYRKIKSPQLTMSPTDLMSQGETAPFSMSATVRVYGICDTNADSSKTAESIQTFFSSEPYLLAIGPKSPEEMNGKEVEQITAEAALEIAYEALSKPLSENVRAVTKFRTKPGHFRFKQTPVTFEALEMFVAPEVGYENLLLNRVVEIAEKRFGKIYTIDYLFHAFVASNPITTVEQFADFLSVWILKTRPGRKNIT